MTPCPVRFRLEDEGIVAELCTLGNRVLFLEQAEISKTDLAYKTCKGIGVGRSTVDSDDAAVSGTDIDQQTTLGQGHGGLTLRSRAVRKLFTVRQKKMVWKNVCTPPNKPWISEESLHDSSDVDFPSEKEETKRRNESNKEQMDENDILSQVENTRKDIDSVGKDSDQVKKHAGRPSKKNKSKVPNKIFEEGSAKKKREKMKVNVDKENSKSNINEMKNASKSKETKGKTQDTLKTREEKGTQDNCIRTDAKIQREKKGLIADMGRQVKRLLGIPAGQTS